MAKIGVEVPRDLGVQRLAAGLVARMPRLLRGGVHIGRVCEVVDRFGLASRGWTAASLLAEIDRVAREAGVRLPGVDVEQNPLGYFTWVLGRTIAPDALPPAVQVEREREAARAELAAARAEEQAKRARMAAEQHAIDEVLAAMRARFPRRPKPRR